MVRHINLDLTKNINQSPYIRASPRLKDASLPPSAINALYEELVMVVRQMFHVCKLVHADLSEYNIMYHEEHLWIIDVSQSVEHDHPSAFDFLRNDIKNVEDFFGRLGVACLGLRRFFEFVTKEKLTDEDDITDEDVLKKLLAEKIDDDVEEAEDEAGDEKDGEALSGPNSKPKPEDAAHEDSVFLHSFIPRRLNEVYDPERDVEKHKKGDGLIYADTIGLVSPSDPYDSAPKVKQPGMDENGEGRTGDEDGDVGSETDDGDGGSGEDSSGFVEKKLRGHRHEDKDTKKASKSVLTICRPLSKLSLWYRNARSRRKLRLRRSDRARCPRLRRNA